MRTSPLSFIAPLCSALVVCASSAGADVTFTGIGKPAGWTNSGLNAISNDGLVFAGAGASPTGGHAFRWTKSGGFQDLGVLPGGTTSNSYGVCVSHVVGESTTSPSSLRAVRWNAAGIGQDLGTLTGSTTRAFGVSADGSVVVGESGAMAYRWVDGQGMTSLGSLQTNGGSSATGVSADGLTVVGSTDAPGFHRFAFRWTPTAGMQSLHTLDTGNSVAAAVSGDGEVVVGNLFLPNDSPRVFRWTATTGMEMIGPPGPEGRSEARAVSGDGSVVVGMFTLSVGPLRPFVWTRGDGIRDLSQLLGTALPAGWRLANVSGISADGRTIVGFGTNPQGVNEGWIATIPSPGPVSGIVVVIALGLRRQRRPDSPRLRSAG